MKRSINSTGRQRITHNMVSFVIHRTSTGEPKSFSADLTGLTVLKLPKTAQIVVEPYFGHSAMRFDFGTVGAIISPSDTALVDIDKGGEINFRVKVTDNGEDGHLGRLLAAGDRIAAYPPSETSDGQLPLLPIKLENLYEKIWDISVADGDRPHLLINSRIPGLLSRIQSDPLLRGAILIEAFRKVLSEMLHPHSGEEVFWAEDWKQFLILKLSITGLDDLNADDDDEREEFIDEALVAFSKKFQFASQALPIDKSEAVFYE